MRTYLGAAIACFTLMLTGIARADHFADYNFQCDARNKSVFLDYRLSCDDLNGGNHNDIHDNNGGNNNNCNTNGNSDQNNSNCGLPPVDNNNGGNCQTPPCDPKPVCPPCDPKCPHDPTDPHDPAVVPLPASSALGGVGLAILALGSWVRSRRVARA
jgi:hypothetical protein